MKRRSKPRPGSGKGSRGTPELTRKAILKAAVHEFANEGIAGARTEAIARAARVNKALLYYYFKDKETLYGAVLDQVFSGLAARMDEVMQLPMPPREKILAFAGAHFDYIAASPIYPKLVQREMMRAGRSGSPHIRRLVEHYLRPVARNLAETIHQGIASGEFRSVDPLQFLFSVVAMNVFYFGSVPVISVVTGNDPLSPERVEARRAAVLDFISAALFTKSAEPVAAERSRQ